MFFSLPEAEGGLVELLGARDLYGFPPSEFEGSVVIFGGSVDPNQSYTLYEAGVIFGVKCDVFHL